MTFNNVLTDIYPVDYPRSPSGAEMAKEHFFRDTMYFLRNGHSFSIDRHRYPCRTATACLINLLKLDDMYIFSFPEEII